MMDRQTLALLLLAAIALYLVMGQNKAGYVLSSGDDRGYVIDDRESQRMGANLIPREVSTDEDFGNFSPDAILSGQNFLDPRTQIGFPETIGGNLRNANRQERSEPPNPRTFPSPWNLSTIPPDLMRPAFEIGSGEF
jgi:hypothetical protein